MGKRRISVALLATATTGLLGTTAALGFGVFGSPSSIPVQVAYQVVLGDLNRDGKMDLVASNDGATISTNGFVFALGKGNGSFKPSEFVSTTTPNPEGAAIGNFNGDRRPDVALGDYKDSSVAFFFGTDAGGFVPGPISASGAGAFLLKTGDFNEDGRTDVVSCNYSSTGDGAISVLLQKRGGGFTAHKDFAGIPSCYGIDVGRLNHDKHLDVVEQGYSGAFAVFLGKGNGSFKPHRDHFSFSSGDGYSDITIGDFTGNGHDGVAVASYDDAKVLVYPGNRNGSLKAPKSTSLGGVAPQGIDAADFNRDGKLDLAIGRYPNGLTVLSGTGNGKFKPTPRTAPASDYTYSAATGRLNKDKAPDIVLGTSSTADIYINGSP